MTKLPDDLKQALYTFVQSTSEIRQGLDASGRPDAQALINAVANLTAAGRAYLPDVLSKDGLAPKVHFVSTIFVPEGVALVTKNDLILWAGRIDALAAASIAGNWPAGATVHLAPATFAAMVEESKGAALKVKR